MIKASWPLILAHQHVLKVSLKFLHNLSSYSLQTDRKDEQLKRYGREGKTSFGFFCIMECGISWYCALLYMFFTLVNTKNK